MNRLIPLLPAGAPAFDVSLGNGLFIVHVENPNGGPAPLTGALLQGAASIRLEDRAFEVDGCETLQRSKDASLFWGTWDPAREVPFDGRSEDGHRVTGRRVAGGGALALTVDSCTGQKDVPLEASRFCEFEPALSGVYAGEATRTGEAAEKTWVALAFRPPLVTGLEWPADGMEVYPRTSRFFTGLYDRFAEGGALAVLSPLAGGEVRRECGRFSLAEAGGEIDLSLDVAASCANPDAVEETITAARLSGSEAAECAPAPTGLVTLWEVRRCGLRRYLDVRVFSADTGQVVDRTAEREVTVAVEHQGRRLDPVADFDPTVTRFELDPPGTGEKKYAVYAFGRLGRGPSSAMPSCLVDKVER